MNFRDLAIEQMKQAKNLQYFLEDEPVKEENKLPIICEIARLYSSSMTKRKLRSDLLLEEVRFNHLTFESTL